MVTQSSSGQETVEFSKVAITHRLSTKTQWSYLYESHLGT